ncbi:MAG: anthranilate/aminodeoxychorismate synthase component II [Acidimicrobiaceae bacterium]|nr:anthranilate/aminodeoxychorismate synthase component II [Acidimicrobiaceae bacterium]
MSSRVLVIDNYDSFVYILVQYLGEIGLEPIVYRNDKLSIQEVSRLDVDAILISPGPGTPSDSGISMDLLNAYKDIKPIFGVCLGLQCIGEFFGGNVIRAPEVMHGKTSSISHTEQGVFTKISNPLEATRYHSLVVERDSLPDVLEITAETDDGIVMGLRHKQYRIEGVQFHPESILTREGHSILKNFFTDI